MQNFEIYESGNIKNLPGPHTFTLPGIDQAKARAAGMQRYSDTVMVIRQGQQVIARRHKAKWEIVQ